MLYFGVFWILVQTEMAICFIAVISTNIPLISLIANVLWILQKNGFLNKQRVAEKKQQQLNKPTEKMF